jgi:hypothetical protein
VIEEKLAMAAYGHKAKMGTFPNINAEMLFESENNLFLFFLPFVATPHASDWRYLVVRTTVENIHALLNQPSTRTDLRALFMIRPLPLMTLRLKHILKMFSFQKRGTFTQPSCPWSGIIATCDADVLAVEPEDIDKITKTLALDMIPVLHIDMEGCPVVTFNVFSKKQMALRCLSRPCGIFRQHYVLAPTDGNKSGYFPTIGLQPPGGGGGEENKSTVSETICLSLGRLSPTLRRTLRRRSCEIVGYGMSLPFNEGIDLFAVLTRLENLSHIDDIDIPSPHSVSKILGLGNALSSECMLVSKMSWKDFKHQHLLFSRRSLPKTKFCPDVALSYVMSDEMLDVQIIMFKTRHNLDRTKYFFHPPIRAFIESSLGGFVFYNEEKKNFYVLELATTTTTIQKEPDLSWLDDDDELPVVSVIPKKRKKRKKRKFPK